MGNFLVPIPNFSGESLHRFPLLKDMEIYVSESYKHLEEELRQRVGNVAILFKPKHHSFIVMLQASDMCSCNLVSS